MSVARLRPAIFPAAQRHALPPELVLALAHVESRGNPWAWNPEPRYRWLWDVRTNQPFRGLTPAEIAAEAPPSDFPALAGDRDQEWWGQRASWGALQVMGAVARERGFAGPYLTELCDPELNVEFACRHLVYLRERFHARHGWEGVIHAYNAGGPYRRDGAWVQGHYVHAVLRAWRGAADLVGASAA